VTLEPLLSASPVIQLHAIAAILAFALGGWIFFGAKGDARHMLMGRIWVGLMAIVALTSLFIWTIRLLGPFSPIHILSVLTFFGLWDGVRHARAGRISLHRREMQQLYVGALLIAGFFTFMPGRIMHHVVFGFADPGPAQWVLFLSAYTGSVAGGFLLLRRRMGWRLPRPGRQG